MPVLKKIFRLKIASLLLSCLLIWFLNIPLLPAAPSSRSGSEVKIGVLAKRGRIKKIAGDDNKETLDNIFEPFFTTKDVDKGTGLGLATIYGICKQNNGFINVYSEPGQGTTFRIYLPRVVTDEDTDEAVPEKKTAVGGTETILLVEDEPTILRMTRVMLEKKGYTVLTAATATEAVEKATNHSGFIDLLMNAEPYHALDSQGRVTVARVQFGVNEPLAKSSFPALQ